MWFVSFAFLLCLYHFVYKVLDLEFDFLLLFLVEQNETCEFMCIVYLVCHLVSKWFSMIFFVSNLKDYNITEPNR